MVRFFFQNQNPSRVRLAKIEIIISKAERAKRVTTPAGQEKDRAAAARSSRDGEQRELKGELERLKVLRRQYAPTVSETSSSSYTFPMFIRQFR